MWMSLTVSLNFGKCSISFAVSGRYWSPATDLSSSQTTVVCRKDFDLLGKMSAREYMWIEFTDLQLHLSLTSCTWNMDDKQFLDEGEQNIAIYTQITADIRDTETMRPRYRIAFPPPRKPYRIRLLFTHKNGCGGAISVTEWSCARLCRSLKRRVTIGRMFILYQIAFRDAMKSYRVFSHDVTAAILVSQNNETAAMLVSQTSPVGVELFSYANAFFCSNKFA